MQKARRRTPAILAAALVPALAWTAVPMTQQQYQLVDPGPNGFTQFAAALGAKPIITSSSDAKLERAKTLGAIATINYRKNPDWEKEVMAITGGTGAQHILDVGGKDTLPHALASLASGGNLALIGGLGGFGGDIPTLALMGRNASAFGIYVGSREDFEAMNAFIEKHKLRPVIDRTFDFVDAKAAIDHMRAGDFVGKIVIRIGGA